MQRGKMARCRKLNIALVLVLLCAAPTITAATAAGVVSYSFPVFNATTTVGFVVATNLSILTPAALVFESSQDFLSGFNSSEGFLLLSHTVDVWRAGADDSGGGVPTREASFNTSFTVDGSAAPVSFVLLLDRFPTLNNPAGLRGVNSSVAAAVPRATNGVATVEAGTVKSYAPESPDVGLNVTITPNSTAAPGRRTAVWIEYNAVAHLLRVYVAAAGEQRPPRALVNAPLSLAGRRTTHTAFVGFFAAEVRDVLLGVRDWDLKVDRFPTDGDGKKGTAWVVILIAVLGSVAATAAIVSVVVCYFVSRRRALSNSQCHVKVPM